MFFETGLTNYFPSNLKNFVAQKQLKNFMTKNNKVFEGLHSHPGLALFLYLMLH